MKIQRKIYEKGDLVKIKSKEWVIQNCTYDKLRKLYISNFISYDEIQSNVYTNTSILKQAIIEEDKLCYCGEIGRINYQVDSDHYLVTISPSSVVSIDEEFIDFMILTEERQAIYNFCHDNCICECSTFCPLYKFKQP